MTAGRSERVVHAAARHLPLRLALDLAAIEASVLHRIGRRAPRPDVVATTFGLDERPARAAARRMAASSAQTRLLRIAWRDGIPSNQRVGQPHGSSVARWSDGPVIFVPVPWGPWIGAAAVIREVRTDFALLANLAPERARSWGVELRRAGTTTIESAAALKWAVDHLEDRGAVGVPFVGDVSNGLAVEVLGQDLTVARGIALLARRSGAPVVPITATWHRGRVELEAHRPVEWDRSSTAPVALDLAMLRALADQISGLARRRPEACDLRSLSMGQSTAMRSS